MIVRQIDVILQYDRKLEHVKLKKIANIHHKQLEMLGEKKPIIFKLNVVQMWLNNMTGKLVP